MHFSTALFAMVSVVSFASAQTLVELPTNQLLNGLAELNGDQALLDLGVIVDVLGPLGCT